MRYGESEKRRSSLNLPLWGRWPSVARSDEVVLLQIQLTIGKVFDRMKLENVLGNDFGAIRRMSVDG